MASDLSLAYVNSHVIATQLLLRLNELLRDYPDPDSVNWGHVGQLQHLNSELSHLVQFMDHNSPAE